MGSSLHLTTGKCYLLGVPHTITCAGLIFILKRGCNKVLIFINHKILDLMHACYTPMGSGSNLNEYGIVVIPVMSLFAYGSLASHIHRALMPSRGHYNHVSCHCSFGECKKDRVSVARKIKALGHIIKWIQHTVLSYHTA